jgi:flagellar M-ring protein FliF
MVRLRPGMRLDSQNVLAVCHLVASAVEGLAPESVAVLDMRGNLLSRARKPASLDIPEPSEAVLEYRRSIEGDLTAKINATLEPLLGADKFHAGVSVDCDFSSGEQSEESFDPTHSVMATSQKTEDVSGTVSAGGVPGTASNLPRPTSRPSGAQGGLTRRTENVTFQTSRTTRRVRLPQGVVKKLSISILVDQAVQWEGKGAGARRLLIPPAPEKLKSIRELVAAATGFNAERGDQLVVETLPFDSTLNAERPEAPGATPAPAKHNPSWMEQLLADRKLLIMVSAGALVALVLVVGILFLLLRRRGPEAKASSAESVTPGGERKSIGPAADGAGSQMEAKLAERETLQRQLEAEALSSLKLPPVVTKKTEVLAKHLRENVKKEPNLSAQVLLSWLREEDEK